METKSTRLHPATKEAKAERSAKSVQLGLREMWVSEMLSDVPRTPLKKLLVYGYTPRNA